MGLQAATGLMSGIDTKSLISQLIAVEKRNQDPVQRAKRAANSEKTAILELNTKLTGLSSAFAALDGLTADGAKVDPTEEILGTKASSADDTVVDVSTTGAAVPGVYSVQVTALASAARRDHAGVADAKASLSATDAVFAFSYAGGAVETINIAAGVTTLEGLRDTINAREAGVRATIIDTGTVGATQFRLVLDGEKTGTSKTITIDAATTLTGFTDVDLAAKAPTDAAFTINGVAVTSESNAATSIEGMTLTLKKAGGAAVDVSVTRDVAGLQTKLEGIADKVNSVLDFLRKQSKFDTTTKTAGVLSGDALALGVTSKLREALGYSLADTSAPYRSLRDIGFSVTSTGNVTVDATVLKTALAANPLAIRNMLRSTDAANPQGLMARMKGALDIYVDTKGGALQGRANTLDANIKRLDKRLTVLDGRAEKLRKRLERQFANLETTLAGLSSTQQFFSMNKIGIY